MLVAKSLDQLGVVGLVAVLGKDAQAGMLVAQLDGAASLVQATAQAVVGQSLLEHHLNGGVHVHGAGGGNLLLGSNGCLLSVKHKHRSVSCDAAIPQLLRRKGQDKQRKLCSGMPVESLCLGRTRQTFFLDSKEVVSIISVRPRGLTPVQTMKRAMHLVMLLSNDASRSTSRPSSRVPAVHQQRLPVASRTCKLFGAVKAGRDVGRRNARHCHDETKSSKYKIHISWQGAAPVVGGGGDSEGRTWAFGRTLYGGGSGRMDPAEAA